MPSLIICVCPSVESPDLIWSALPRCQLSFLISNFLDSQTSIIVLSLVLPLAHRRHFPLEVSQLTGFFKLVFVYLLRKTVKCSNKNMTQVVILALNCEALLLSHQLFHSSGSLFVACTYIYAASGTVSVFALSLCNRLAKELFSIKQSYMSVVQWTFIYYCFWGRAECLTTHSNIFILGNRYWELLPQD